MRTVTTEPFAAVEEEPGPRFGDPIGCAYHWVDPAEVDDYGAVLRRLAGRVELAADALARTAGMPEDDFAGEAADALRGRAQTRQQEAAALHEHLRGLGRAVDAHADVLRAHREGLHDLRALAESRGLEVRDHRVWPPVSTLPGDATQDRVDAWQDDWRAYQACFDLAVELRETRRERTRDLVRALAEHAGVRPERDGAHLVLPARGEVSFGRLRERAAEEAMEAVRADEAADAARAHLAVARRSELAALDTLEQLLASGAPAEDVQAQIAAVAVLRDDTDRAGRAAEQADATAATEQAQAARAARHLHAAEGRDGASFPASRPTPPPGPRRA